MIYRCSQGSSVSVDTQLILNKNLSAEARLILIIILTHSDNHRFSPEELVTESGLSKYKVIKALKELKDNKYLQYKPVSVAGRFNGVEWIIKENPDTATSNNAATSNNSTEVISTTEFNFNRIWEAYPADKRCDRKAALKAYKQIPNADDIIEDILSGLQEMKGTQNWIKDGGQWIPGLPKFLSYRIWEKGLENPTSAQGFKTKLMEAYKNATV